MKNILVLTTGGTIDRETHLPRGYTSFEPSRVPQAVLELGLGDQCVVQCWKKLPSDRFNKKDEATHVRHIMELADTINHASEKYIVVTHGTDKMVGNCQQIIPLIEPGKVVAFTGAIVPLSEGAQSDGYQNLKTAITQIERQPPGVHITMQGEWFDPAHTRKTRGGKFQVVTQHECEGEGHASRFKRFFRNPGSPKEGRGM